MIINAECLLIDIKDDQKGEGKPNSVLPSISVTKSFNLAGHLVIIFDLV